jgi:hypothetical protein
MPVQTKLHILSFLGDATMHKQIKCLSILSSPNILATSGHLFLIFIFHCSSFFHLIICEFLVPFFQINTRSPTHVDVILSIALL